MAVKKEAAVSDLFAGLNIEFEDKPNTHFNIRPTGPAAPKETPEEKARRVLTTALAEQVKLLDNPEYTREVTRYVKDVGKTVKKEAPKPIWIEQDDGTCFVTIRYGVRMVPIQPGMVTAKMPRASVKPFIEKFIELVNAGEYDSVLVGLSKR